jgi:predicted enzyme related to lactoylglutathione lyase
MTFELFDGGTLPTSDPSGRGQAIRPGIQVADLHGTIAEMRQRGVQFTGAIERTAFGEWIEFTAPENMRWTLAHAPSYPFGANLRKAHIGWIELKVDQLSEQQAFYCKVLGFQSEASKDGRIVLRQKPGEPLLFLKTGGERTVPLQINQGAFQPLPSHLLSFETENIEEAAAWLKSHQVPILIGITHKTWGGIDLYIADLDGNPIQIVLYLPHG